MQSYFQYINLWSENAKKYLGFNDILLMAILIPVITAGMPLAFFGIDSDIESAELTHKLINSLIYTVSYWLGCRTIFIYSRKKFPQLKQITRRILLTSTLILIFFAAFNTFMALAIDPILCDQFMVEPDDHSVKFIVPSLVIIALVSSIYEGVYLYYQLKQSIEEKEQLKRENIQSQLQGLRNQVNPHFLFNSLNTLIYLIPEDPDRAVKFVNKLSKTYRYILEIRDKKLVSLSEEFEFLKAYLFLIKERFGENLHVKVDIPDHFLDHQIVSLSLQILLENAIKHNIISTQKPLTIEVFVKNDQWLVVRNNLQKKKQVANSTGAGLQNIRNRYRFFSDREVEVIVTTQHFIVTLPLIPTKESAKIEYA